MKLSRLYCNQPEIFPAIKFNSGLNVVLADIRNPENYTLDTHNLGKTTFASLIDFCLLKGSKKSYFLFKHIDLFYDFIFFLEISTDNGEFITIRRPVNEATKISFVTYKTSQEDLMSLDENHWHHWKVSFRIAKELLDAKLDFSKAKRWSYRKPLGYALRLQDDYNDVFQLSKYKGAHHQWKPFLAELIGLDGELVRKTYDLNADIDLVQNEINEVKPLLCGLEDSPDKLEGIILIHKQAVGSLSRQVDNFDFKISDSTINTELVEKIETSVAVLNERRYHLQMSLDSINDTLNSTIQFDLNKVEGVFADAEIYFGEQLKYDYEQLQLFLKSISEERAGFLKIEKEEIITELEEIDYNLTSLNERRIEALSILREAESLTKFRKHTELLVNAKAKLDLLEQQSRQMDRLFALKRKRTELVQQRNGVLQALQDNLSVSSKSNGTYRSIRTLFTSVIESVLDEPAVMSCRLNNLGNLEFSSEFLDGSGIATSADSGYSYKKLLCIAFDIAVFSSYLRDSFLHFVYHDGFFESLDDRKKLCLLKQIRKCCNSGLQQIVTVISSDLPKGLNGEPFQFNEGEIVRLLHDQGDSGRLFKMPSW